MPTQSSWASSNRALHWAFITALVFVLASVALAAIDRGGIARGVLAQNVTFLRSAPTITVAGDVYDVTQSVFNIDGVPGTQADLKQGQVIHLLDIVYPEEGETGLPTVG
ncbi:MAG: hypothetical protein AAFX85_09970, partial [Pseudomonadota bacterium]